MSLVEQELLTLSEHLSYPRFLVGFVLLESLILCVCFVDRCFSFCNFSFVHCVVCSSSIYGFWLPLWYLQTLLTVLYRNYIHILFLKLNWRKYHEHDSKLVVMCITYHYKIQLNSVSTEVEIKIGRTKRFTALSMPTGKNYFVL